MASDKDYFLLTGRRSDHIVNEGGVGIHKDALSDFRKLRDAAKEEGVAIQIASGFRDFERQLSIWNFKASGRRPVRDRHENLINFNSASKSEILEGILTWSALPGASRHHWGTELDIFDANIKSRENVSLTQQECAEDFERLYEWLDKNLQQFNFHRPYAKDLGGVAREPWHLSHTSLSKAYESIYTIDVLRKSVMESDLLLKEEVLNSLDWIYANYIKNVSPA